MNRNTCPRFSCLGGTLCVPSVEGRADIGECPECKGTGFVTDEQLAKYKWPEMVAWEAEFVEDDKGQSSVSV